MRPGPGLASTAFARRTEHRELATHTHSVSRSPHLLALPDELPLWDGRSRWTLGELRAALAPVADSIQVTVSQGSRGERTVVVCFPGARILAFAELGDRLPKEGA